MSIDHYQRQLHELYRSIARLQQDKGRAARDAADKLRRAAAAEQSAARTASAGLRLSKLKEAERLRSAAVGDHQRAANLEARIGRDQARVVDVSKRLSAAQDHADRKRRSDEQRAARDHARRMQTITGRLTRHDELHGMTLSALNELRNLPEHITILFVAANPLDQQHLRLDEEARAIDERVRMSEHRDALHFQTQWALRPGDLIQALNRFQPRIVHFSGHGADDDAIVFQDEAGNAKPVPKSAIVAVMAASSGAIDLVFFNTCFSQTQAEAVVAHVPAAIGMASSIGDDAARIFAANFYAAIGFGLSVGRAFRQARAALMLESIPEDATPQLFVAEGIDPETLILVRPADVRAEVDTAGQP